MGDPFLAEVRMMSFLFPPKGWAWCNGGLMPIAQNEALFSVLGATFGGDGESNFALPDFRGRVPIHAGSGHRIGERGGSETVTLTEQEMPQHSHRMKATDTKANAADPGNAVLGAVERAYGDAYGRPTTLHPAAVSKAGRSKPHDNMQPYLALPFFIALEGLFPHESWGA